MKLSRWLQQNDVSQQEFAALLSKELGRVFYQGTISKYVAGTLSPRLEVAVAIRRLTGGDVAEADWIARKGRRPRAS